MKFKNKNLVFATLLGSILVLASILRFANLQSVPPSLYWDEVSQAYNAYSILETGYDEHGERYPIARFIAFGDYKAPVLIYLMVPSMMFFGNSDFAVRFPSAFLGTLTVLVVYFLVYELLRKRGKKQNITRPEIRDMRYVPIISAALLAISPWHIQLSRGAYEGNVAQFFMVLGVYLFLLSRRLSSWWLVGSSVSFVVGMYAFNAHRVTIPLMIIALFIVYRKHVFYHIKQVVVSIMLAVLFLIPLFQFIQSPEGKLRFQEVNIFSDLEVIRESNRLIEHDGNTLFSRIIHNRRVLFARSYIRHYLDFFNPTYLFISGDENPRFSHQDTGQLYLFMLPFIILGFYVLAVRRDKVSATVFLWFFLAPVVAATARETPHALRSITYIPTYEIFAAVGIGYALYLTKRYAQKYTLFIYGFIVLGFLTSLVYFSYSYFVHFPRIYAGQWQYGYKQVVEYVSSVEDDYDTIIFTKAYGRPYIYVAYYGSINPKEYVQMAETERDYYGFYTVSKVGKYIFQNPQEGTSDRAGKMLYIGTPGEMSDFESVLHTIYFPNGTPAFVIVE